MSNSFVTAHVETPTDSTVKVVRDFKAPPDLVWQAYTQPKLIKRWMGALPGWSFPVCEMDVRPGGKYRWVWRTDDGNMEFGFHGTFHEVEAPRLMSFDQTYDPGTMGGSMGDPATMVTTFERIGAITRMVSLMDFGTKASRDAAVSTGMTDGMEVSYGALDKLVAELR